ncbi:MAG: cobyric acid synthase [Deltaproteobacteria bacterium]|nr:cobyric acid synthase [Deltaproteobacteria bacterium]
MALSRKPAPTLMIQGTSSSVGKSLLVTALCRLYARQGMRVAPFKSQNMALNAHVTPDGLEIGRAQAVQAQAAGTPARVEMNPILLKPQGNSHSQVVVMGRSQGVMSAAEYQKAKEKLKPQVADCLNTLRAEYDLVIIEGAGSPAEVNLKPHDIVNMHVAFLAESPVVLVGDIDRGGVFAALLGTLDLLPPRERRLVAGLVINKFRGDFSLLEPGVDFIRERGGVPVLGVLPHIPALRVAQEDSLGLEERLNRPKPGPDTVDVAVVCYPRISNYDDLDPLEHEPGVAVRYITRPDQFMAPDLVVLPGSKATFADLDWLKEQGFGEVLTRYARSGGAILAICGGCQMAGRLLEDPHGVESSRNQAQGLGLLPLTTRFSTHKRTTRVEAVPAGNHLLSGIPAGSRLADRPDGSDGPPAVEGYEIHMGRVKLDGGGQPAFRVIRRNGGSPHTVPVEGDIQDSQQAMAGEQEDSDGAAAGNVVGTMLHGLLENDSLRAGLLAGVRQSRGLASPPDSGKIPGRMAEYDRLADVVERCLDMARLKDIIGLEPLP